MSELGTIGSAAKGIGEGIEHALTGVDKLMARIQDMAHGPLSVRRAKKQSDSAKVAAEGAIAVAETAGVELGEKEKRAIVFHAMREIRGFENIEETIALADIPPDVDFGKIDDEWMSAFIDGAKDAFSEWKRSILAKAVERKSIDPRSMPIRALHAISKMESGDIDCFERVCGLRPEVDGKIGDPMIVTLDPSALRLVGLDSDGIMSLCDAGLMRRSASRFRKIAADERTCRPNLDRHVYEMCHWVEGSRNLHTWLRFPKERIEVPALRVYEKTAIKSETYRYIDYGDFRLTEAGRALAEIVSPVHLDDIKDYIELGYEIEGGRESERLSDGVFCEREFRRAVKKALSGGL